MFKFLKCENINDSNLLIELIDDKLYFSYDNIKENLNVEETKFWLEKFTNFCDDEFGIEDLIYNFNLFNRHDTLKLYIEFDNRTIQYDYYFGDLINIFLNINLFRNTPFYVYIKAYEEEVTIDLFKSIIKIKNDIYREIIKTYECESDIVEIMNKIDYKCINKNYGDYYTVTINYLNKTIKEDFEYLDTESIKLLRIIKDKINEMEQENGRSMLEYFEDYEKESKPTTKKYNNYDVNDIEIMTIYLVATVTFSSFGGSYDYLCDDTFEVGEIALTDTNKKVKIESISNKSAIQLPVSIDKMQRLRKLIEE